MTDPTCGDCGAPVAPLNDCYCPPSWVDWDNAFPFGRLPKYTAIGGYAIFAIVDDGEYLCPDCVNDESNPVHFGGDSDGWRIEGIGSTAELEYDVYTCAHCNHDIGA